MKIEWTVKKETPQSLKEFLKDKGVSRRMLAKVKFHGGNLEVNGEDVRVRRVLEKGDIVHMTLPIGESNPNLYTTHEPLDILFEDKHYLLVNKPVGVISVPSPAHREDTMASRVKGYVTREGYDHQSVHVVTRLDRDTSGVMMFAKHAFAHSMVDQLLQDKTLIKEYIALVHGNVEKDHDFIQEPIARSQESIIVREVGEGGKDALTEYWVEERLNDISLVRVQLHTGRTHQIRVHFSHIGYPLLGDDLYGGDNSHFERQALHCKSLSFTHPITEETIEVEAPLPPDMQEIIQTLRG